MKGISMTMQIVIVVIILLVAAMVVLSVFGVQMGGISNTIGGWLGLVPKTPVATDCTVLAAKDCTIMKGCIVCPTDPKCRSVTVGC